jgi:hypothetical protein
MAKRRISRRIVAFDVLNEAIAYNPDYRQAAVSPGIDIVVSLGGPDLWRRTRIPLSTYVRSRD